MLDSVTFCTSLYFLCFCFFFVSGIKLANRSFLNCLNINATNFLISSWALKLRFVDQLEWIAIIILWCPDIKTHPIFELTSISYLPFLRNWKQWNQGPLLNTALPNKELHLKKAQFLWFYLIIFLFGDYHILGNKNMAIVSFVTSTDIIENPQTINN